MLNEPSRKAWNIVSQAIHKNCLRHCQVVVINIITRTDNGKAELTIRNVKEHVNSMELDIVDNKNIGANELIKGGLHLNDWESGKLPISFVKKIKTLHKN